MNIEALKTPEAIDRALDWPIGRTKKLVRQGALLHYILPDGSIRLDLEDVCRCIQRVDPRSSGSSVGQNSPSFVSPLTAHTIGATCAVQQK